MDKSPFTRQWLLVMVLTILGLYYPGWSQCPQGDLNGDCRIDLDDFKLMSDQWLDIYNTDKLAILTSNWSTDGIYITDPRDIEFVTIPAGSFQMGDNFNEGYGNELPVHTVTLSSFQMSKQEITNAQYAQFLNEAKAQNMLKEVNGVIYASTDSSNSQLWCDTSIFSSQSLINSSDGSYSVKSRNGNPQDNHPIVRVSWYGAKAFCDFYGYKLPTEAQWEYAARGAHSGWRFPWGTFITHSHANFDSYYIASYNTSFTRGYHPTYNTGTKPYTSPVGSFNANSYGLFDMSGNVREWCADWYNPSAL